ncbi:MAG: signal peptidase I [Alteromonadaceae bacterium]|nr:signal peptidase I [Alteromonadaceae bacterium]
MANYFSIFLVILTVASGLIWLLDAILWAPKRKEKIALAKANTRGAIDEQTIEDIAPIPSIVDTAQQIFPVIAFVLVLRSFLYEPFQIPSGSMMPTLLVGDFILVEKFTYGLKDPVVRKQFYDVGKPERGDIVVFKYPEDTNIDYIKRVVGLPGDTVIYRNKRLYIKPACTDETNCPAAQPVPVKKVSSGEFMLENMPLDEFTESFDDHEHNILRNPAMPEFVTRYFIQQNQRVAQWVVPAGQYFVLGDNRDNSRDSRFWGFVPEENLVGKAVAIWMSFEFERPQDSVIPGWVPSGVRFERIGGLK